MRRLDEDESRKDYLWYANVSNGYGNKKYISFTMFDPVDWKNFESWYSESRDVLHFCSNCDREDKITVKVMRKMIDFIESDDFKNIEIKDDDAYHEYMFEI